MSTVTPYFIAVLIEQYIDDNNIESYLNTIKKYIPVARKERKKKVDKMIHECFYPKL